jgi:ABC-type transporter Mla MlaB component
MKLQAKRSNKNGESRMVLQGDLTIYTVNKLHMFLVKQIKKNNLDDPQNPCRIDISELESLDSAGYQLLLRYRLAHNEGWPIHIIGSNSVYEHLAATYERPDLCP